VDCPVVVDVYKSQMDRPARARKGWSSSVKIKHVALLALAVIGVLYVAHMMTSHKGSQIIPGLGLSH
jgi:hypothetical protein